MLKQERSCCANRAKRTLANVFFFFSCKKCNRIKMWKDDEKERRWCEWKWPKAIEMDTEYTPFQWKVCRVWGRRGREREIDREKMKMLRALCCRTAFNCTHKISKIQETWEHSSWRWDKWAEDRKNMRWNSMSFAEWGKRNGKIKKKFQTTLAREGKCWSSTYAKSFVSESQSRVIH